MRQIAGSCPNANCPKIFDAEDGANLLVQGYTQDMTTPEGESVVSLPIEYVLAAADNYRASQRA